MRDDVIDRICNSQTSDAEALALLQRAYQRSPRVDLLLLERAREAPEWLPRALRLLASVSNAHRLASPLLPLLHHTDPKVRELAVLLVARGRNNPQWAREMMNDPDPRVRANVIEGSQQWEEDMELLNRALQDTHHRVVCNGIVSLYRIRPLRARMLLERTLSHTDWHFRAAATWACGAIGSEELEGLVTKMRSDPHPSVRWNALRAATALHRARAPAITGESGGKPSVAAALPRDG